MSESEVRHEDFFYASSFKQSPNKQVRSHLKSKAIISFPFEVKHFSRKFSLKGGWDLWNILNYHGYNFNIFLQLGCFNAKEYRTCEHALWVLPIKVNVQCVFRIYRCACCREFNEKFSFQPKLFVNSISVEFGQKHLISVRIIWLSISGGFCWILRNVIHSWVWIEDCKWYQVLQFSVCVLDSSFSVRDKLHTNLIFHFCELQWGAQLFIFLAISQQGIFVRICLQLLFFLCFVCDIQWGSQSHVSWTPVRSTINCNNFSSIT